MVPVPIPISYVLAPYQRRLVIGPPDDPPPAAIGVPVPGPEPFPPGPLRWTARRLDQAEGLTR